MATKDVWPIYSTPIIFNFWSSTFDTSRETLDVALLWACFPGLSTHMWNPHIFTNLGNNLGCFLELDYSFKESIDLFIAKILVILLLRNKLHETTNIGKEYVKIQVIDYEGLPLRC